ncbi:MAG: restriction endonuclease subunit S [bacterium]|nr:restriction endonuclease subunit S [bacterium]
MNNAQKLFYCQCLKANKFRFSYGRQANVTLPDLLIPTLDSIPDYVSSFSLKNYGVTLLKECSFICEASTYPHSDETVPLEQLFFVENGVASSTLLRSKKRENSNWIPYIRPSYRQETSLDAYVNRQLILPEKIFPRGTLYVSTDGQGSHTYAYVSTFEFIPNSNVSVLKPKRIMSLQEKLFYAMCITKNRYKFSYGRKPKGVRLKTIQLPLYPPESVLEYDISKVITSFSNALEQL